MLIKIKSFIPQLWRRMKSFLPLFRRKTQARKKKCIDEEFTPREQLAMIWLLYRCEVYSPFEERRVLNYILLTDEYRSIRDEYPYYYHNLPPEHVQKRLEEFKTCLYEIGLYEPEIDEINYNHRSVKEWRNSELNRKCSEKVRRMARATEIIVASVLQQ